MQNRISSPSFRYFRLSIFTFEQIDYCSQERIPKKKTAKKFQGFRIFQSDSKENWVEGFQGIKISVGQ